MTPNPSPGTVQETAHLKRFNLSVLAGFALLGLLATAIWDFAGFTANEQAFFITHIHKGNYKLLTVVSAIFEGKMVSLLAMIFGAGIVLLAEKEKQTSSIDGTDALIRRQIGLIILGLAVGLLILWPNDVLFGFGITGILLFAFCKLPAKSLLIGALVCTIIYGGKIYWVHAESRDDYKAYLAVKAVEKKFAADSIARAHKDSISGTRNKLADSLAKKRDTLTNKQAGDKDNWEGLVKSLKYDSAKTAANNKLMRSGYTKMWFGLKGKVQEHESNWMYSMGVWDYASAMFLGMALLGLGFFSRRYSSSRYVWLAIVLTLLGMGLAWFRIHFNAMRLTDYSKYTSDHALPYNQFYPLERLLLATAYAAWLLWLIQFRTWTWLGELFSAVGKMALTNYLLLCLISALWFYGYGFGYYGLFNQWEMYAAAAETGMVIIVFSVLWLRFYKNGPVEWAFKCIIYQKKLPNKL